MAPGRLEIMEAARSCQSERSILFKEKSDEQRSERESVCSAFECSVWMRASMGLRVPICLFMQEREREREVNGLEGATVYGPARMRMHFGKCERQTE